MSIDSFLSALIPLVSAACGISITAGAFVVVRHVSKSATDPQTSQAARIITVFVLLWVLIAWFRTTVMQPLPTDEIFDRGPRLFETAGALVITVLPLIAYAMARATSPAFNRLVDQLDPRLLVGSQFYRVTGVVFLLLALDKKMPATIGVPTGIAAFCTGILGLSLYVLGNVEALWWRRASVLWSLFGLTYFTYASTTSLAAAFGWASFDIDPAPIFTYPIAFIVAFGLPFSIIVHLTIHSAIHASSSGRSGARG